MKFRRAIAPLALALALVAGTASASSISVYFAADGSDCDATITAGSQPTTYILAHLYSDIAANGITGAEFQVTGWPAGWFNNVFQNPAAVVFLGNPIAGGCNINFPGCMPGPFVLLYTINSFATSTPGPTTLTVTQHNTPSNPLFQCPLLVICDPPVFTKVCVRGGQAYINGPNCSVGVEPRTIFGCS